MGNLTFAIPSLYHDPGIEPQPIEGILEEPIADAFRQSWAISASQLETLDTCERKWAWEKIGGYASPGSSAAILGGQVHHQLERYLIDGTLPNQELREGQIATAGIHLLPDPGKVEVEKDFRFVSPRGNVFQGRKDFRLGDFDPQLGPCAFVGDHKTTSDKKWAKTPETLRTNIQALVYAADELKQTGADSVQLLWVYYLTRGTPKAWPVPLHLTREEIEQGFQKVDILADKLHRIRLKTHRDNILDLPPTLESCEKFGGCPHRHRCNFTPGGRLQAVMSFKESAPSNMSNLPPLPPGTADLMARLQGQAGLPVAPQAPTMVAPPALPTPVAPPMDPLAALRARQAGAVPVAPPMPTPVAPMAPPMAPPAMVAPAPLAPPPAHIMVPPPAPVVMTPPPAPVAPPPVAPTAAAAPVIPPGTPLAPPPPGGSWYLQDGINFYSCHCGLQASLDILTKTGGACPSCNRAADHFPSWAFNAPVNPPEQHLPPPVDAAAHPNVVAPPALPVAPVAPQLTAPPATAEAPAPAAPAENVGVVSETKAKGRGRPAGSKNKPKAAEAPVANSSGSGKAIGRLLINCLPQDGAPSADMEIFAIARELVTQKRQVPDYRLLDYGQGPGEFSHAVSQVLAAGSWDTIYVDTTSADASIVLGLLQSNADETIRGVR